MEYKLIKIDSIELDIENPRIAVSLANYKKVTEEAIELALGSGVNGGEQPGTTFLSLKESIRVNGGIIHPIIVNKDTKSGKITVIEGNTRVQIYRNFKRDKVKGNWDEIPAIVHEDLKPEYIDAIRLQAHMVGPREWDPYSKAKYLHYLYTNECLSMNQIVEFCGGNKNEINGYIEAYKIMENNYRPLLDTDQDFDRTRFSAFREVIKSSIRTALSRHGFDLNDFSKWVIEDRFGPLTNIRKLPRVLDNPSSKKAFLTKNMDEALKFLDVQSSHVDIGKASLFQLCNEVIKRIVTIQFTYIKDLRNGRLDQEKDTIIDTKDKLVEICKEIEGDE